MEGFFRQLSLMRTEAWLSLKIKSIMGPERGALLLQDLA